MAKTAALAPRENRLLAAMPRTDYQQLLPSLERMLMPLGQALYESGETQGFVYGATAEIAVTGRDGLVGIALFMGGETTPSRAVVQSAGEGYRLRASTLKQEFDRGGALQHLLLRYTQALITQMAAAQPRSPGRQP